MAAFDPKLPSALYLIESKQIDQSPRVRFVLAEDGTGSALEETSALQQLLDARDDNKNESIMGMRMLCRNYRKILLECQKLWKNRLLISTRASTSGYEEENLLLFESTLGIVHLSEIYLLAPSLDGDAVGNENTAGIVTADTVRYLRQNHMQSAVESLRHLLPSSMLLDDFLAQPQPEHYAPHGREQDLTPFWLLIRKLVLRGCLEEAWDILEKHSAYRRCQIHVSGKIGTSTIHPTVSEDNEAFHLIKVLLFTAPLPGGRNSLDDTSSIEDQDRVMEQSFNGISSLAYKLWDVDSRNRDRASNQFNIHSAYNLYKRWKSSVSNLLKTNVPLKNLLNRIPFLKTCIWDVILATKEFFIDSDDSWSEILAHELIYIQPYIRKEDVHVRWSAAIKTRVKDSGTLSILDISKSIMEGNSAIVLESLHTWGGKSGAALPATQTALLCDLLTKTNQLQPSLEGYDLHTELLLNAASSIISSFACQGHNDVGMRTAIRLLLPYAGPSNIRVNAQLSEHLSRHYPKSDNEADSLLSLCRPLVSLGSRRILDACESITLCRAQYHERAIQWKKAASWLLKGIDLHRQAVNGMEGSKETDPVLASPNFSKLLCLCSRESEALLCSCRPTESMNVLNALVRRGDEVVQAVETFDINDAVGSHPSFLLFSGLVSLGKKWVLEKYQDVAKDIVYCLDDRLDPYGAVITLAHPSTYGRYLELAYVILTKEERAATSFTDMPSCFDVYGIQILMMRFTQLESLADYGYHVKDKKKQDFVVAPKEMQQALAKGLMRAFVAENAKLRVQPSVPKTKNFSGAVTSEEIDSMLEPSFFM